jgi:multiple sugar transport system substrate-binding protein
MSETHRSRRQLLVGIAGMAGTLALAACGANVATGSAQTSASVTAALSSSAASSATSSAVASSAAQATSTTSAAKATAATSSVAPEPTKIPVKAGQTAIEYWYWGSTDYDAREKRIADGFMQANPSVVVNLSNPSGSLYEKLLAAFAGDSAPDSFAMDLPWVIQFGAAGLALDLAPRIHQDKDAWLDQYLNDPLSKPMYDIIYQYKGGQILALTGEASPNIMFYNGDLFRQKGLKTPYELYQADQWTWENFLDAARKINAVKPDGSYTTAAAAMGQARLWIDAAGGAEFDDVRHPTKCLYDQSADVTALNFLRDAINKDKIIPGNFNKQVGTDTDKAFMAGRLAMNARWTTGIGIYKDITQFKWGMAPYPKKATYANDYATGGPTMVAIAKGKPTNDAAWSYAKYKCGPDGLMIFAEWGTGVPFSKNAQDKTLQVHKSIASLETPGFDFTLLETGKYDFFRLLSKDQSKINDIINKHEPMIWNAQADTQTAATQITQEVNAFLQQNPQ